MGKGTIFLSSGVAAQLEVTSGAGEALFACLDAHLARMGVSHGDEVAHEVLVGAEQPLAALRSRVEAIRHVLDVAKQLGIVEHVAVLGDLVADQEPALFADLDLECFLGRGVVAIVLAADVLARDLDDQLLKGRGDVAELVADDRLALFPVAQPAGVGPGGDDLVSVDETGSSGDGRRRVELAVAAAVS